MAQLRVKAFIRLGHRVPGYAAGSSGGGRRIGGKLRLVLGWAGVGAARLLRHELVGQTRGVVTYVDDAAVLESRAKDGGLHHLVVRVRVHPQVSAAA